MPKIKTVRGAVKRFKPTGSGRLKRRHANLRHILTKKSPNRKRALRKMSEIHAADTHAVRAMLNI